MIPPCPQCRAPMNPVFAIEHPEQEGLDERAIAFCAEALDRGDQRRWAVYECISCGCECRAYLPAPSTPESSMADDELARRRRYDDSVPAMAYIEEKLLRAFEEGLRDTRHALKQDITALATAVTNNALKATQEHADVRADLNELRREVADLKPLRERVAELQEHDRTDNAVADALERNRKVGERNTLQTRNWALTIIGLILALAGVLVAFVPH